MDVQDSSLSALVPAVVERLPVLLDEIRGAFSDQWPDYARFLADHSDDVAPAAALAVGRVVSLTTTGIVRDGVDRELFEEIGRQQWREGKDLAVLLSAYRTGVRVFWRHVSAIALEIEVQPAEVAALAEAVFTFVDHLSSSSARGYVLEQTRSGAERERRRDELATLLLSDRADATEVEGAARRAGWELPAEVAVVLVDAGSSIAQETLARADSSFLRIRRPSTTGLIVPDPSRPGRRAQLAAVLRGAGATVGGAVRLDQLPASLHVAEVAARLLREGLLTDDPVFIDEHLDAIIVHHDQSLLDALRDQVLAPLSASAPASRERLAETLNAWLRHMGDRQTIAAELHVHPQTVSYRMGRLQELFGEDLENHETRARLMLALAWS